MARPKKYTEKALRKAVDRYFDSISREITIKEKVPTGKKDSWGHEIFELVTVKNKLGQDATKTEYLVPPTFGGLCAYLQIDASTWSRWTKEVPEFKEIVERARDRILAWRQEQVLVRKDVKGLIWDMEVNFGCVRDKVQADERPHGVVLLPQINALEPPVDEEGSADV